MNAFPAKPISMDEAAEHLGVSKTTLTKAIKRLPYYELRGRKKVFYPEHIAQLRQGMHECALQSNGSTDGPMRTELPLMAKESAALSALKTLAKQRKPGHTLRRDFGEKRTMGRRPS